MSGMPSRLKIAEKMPNIYLKCRGTSADFLDKNVRHVGENLFWK